MKRKTYRKLIKPSEEQLVDTVNELLESVNTVSASAETENYKGKPGDIKVNKVGRDKYEFYVKGEDGWHKDTNSSYAPVGNTVSSEGLPTVMMQNNGTIDNSFKGTTRILLDLDKSVGHTGTASPKIKITGNGTFSTTGHMILDSSRDLELNTDTGNLYVKDADAELATLNSTGLKVNNISAAGSDTDKFLVSDSGVFKYRTGAQVLSDIGAGTGSGDITGVSITTDSGSGSKAEDTGGSADFSILGSNGVGVTNSGTTITATAVPGEIDHDSLNNFVANEHIDWTGASAGTIHATNYTNTTYSEATGSAEGLMSTAHHDKLDGIEASADVTDATNVTAAGALMDSEMTDLAGVKGVTISTLQVKPSEGAFANGDKTKLDGIEASATADQTKSDIDGLAITTVGALSSGSIASGFGAIDNGSSNITTTGDASFGKITAGAVIWQFFPFQAQTITNGRMHYVDVDDVARYRLWDDYDTDPTGFDYRDVGGQFIVPEDCTLVAMRGVLANTNGTTNPEVGIYYGTVTESASNTTLAIAAGSGGGAKTVGVTTMRVPYTFNDVFNVNLDAGDIVVPTISHTDTSGTRTFVGSITLKFITR